MPSGVVELVAQARGVALRLAGLAEDRVARRRVAEVVEAAADHRRADLVHPHVGAREVVARRRGRGRHGDVRAREHRRELAAEAQTLDRVVRLADDVEPAAEPAGRARWVQGADLVEVARGEVRLVRVVVGDRRQQRRLARVVEVLERLGLRVPAQVGEPGDRQRAGLVEARCDAQRLVVRVVDGREHAHAVDAACEEDRDDDRLGGAGERLGDARVERVEAEAVGAVDRQEHPGAAEQHRAARHARAGGGRHAVLDRRQALPGRRHRAAQELGAGEVVAAAHGGVLSRSGDRGRRGSGGAGRSGAARGGCGRCCPSGCRSCTAGRRRAGSRASGR